ncbi:unnamed protein product [Closterium sp. NIES-65]|nr:unnamed protein product [Closterium sp. NIES-65]
MASTDLTSKIAPFLDRHLVFPLLEFLQDRQIYPEEEILTAKIELLGRTNMVDYAMDIHKSLHHSEEVPPAMVERRGEVVSRLKTLEEAAAPLVAFLQNPATVQELRSDKAYNLLMLQEKYQLLFSPSPLPRRLSPPSFRSFRASVTCRSRSSAPSSFPLPLPPAQIGAEGVEALCWYAKFQFECGSYSGAAIGAEGVEALYWYAKFQFECGNYSGAADFLYQYRLLCSSPQRALSASWGKLAAELLMQNWDAAGEELARVKEMIDSQVHARGERGRDGGRGVGGRAGSRVGQAGGGAADAEPALFLMLHYAPSAPHEATPPSFFHSAFPTRVPCTRLLHWALVLMLRKHTLNPPFELPPSPPTFAFHETTFTDLRVPVSGAAGAHVAAALGALRHAALGERPLQPRRPLSPGQFPFAPFRPFTPMHPLTSLSPARLSLGTHPKKCLLPPLPPSPSPSKKVPSSPPIRYLSAIQTNAQHLLLYLVAAVLTCTHCHSAVKEVTFESTQKCAHMHALRVSRRLLRRPCSKVGYLVAAVLTCTHRHSAVKEVARVVEDVGANAQHLLRYLVAAVLTCKPRPLFPYAPRPPTPCSPSRQVSERHSDERAAPAALPRCSRAHMQAPSPLPPHPPPLPSPNRYLSAIQTNAQHLLRYLVAAVLTCKRRRSAVKEVARVVEAERHAYSDPLTQFLLALVVDLDFDEAQSRLKECEELLSNVFFLGKRMAEGGRVRGPQLLSNDFFLGKRVAGRRVCGGAAEGRGPLRDEVIDSARLLMFENYCSIHRRIDIKVVAEKKSMATDAAELWMFTLCISLCTALHPPPPLCLPPRSGWVAEKLSMATDAAERWMANLIRTAKLDATIDSEAGTLVMATAQPNVYVAGHGYENLIERSRGLTSRTYALASNVAAIALQQ